MLFHSCLHEMKRKSNTHTKLLKSIKYTAKWLLLLAIWTPYNKKNIAFFSLLPLLLLSLLLIYCVLPQMESTKEQQMIKLYACWYMIWTKDWMPLTKNLHSYSHPIVSRQWSTFDQLCFHFVLFCCCVFSLFRLLFIYLDVFTININNIIGSSLSMSFLPAIYAFMPSMYNFTMILVFVVVAAVAFVVIWKTVCIPICHTKVVRSILCELC